MTFDRTHAPPVDAVLADAARLGSDAAADVDDMVAHAVPPGLADVLLRARKIDPQRFHDDHLAEAAALDALDDDHAESAAHFGVLGTFLADAQAFAEDVAERAVPDASAPAAVGRAPWHRRYAVALVAVAAAAVLIPAVSWLLSSMVLEPAPQPGYSIASDRAEQVVPERARLHDPPPPNAPRAEPVTVPDEEILPDELPDSVVPEPPRVRVEEPRAPSKPTKRERLHALDESARAAWALGDLATAEAKFSELVRMGGRDALADIAYGDLFSVLRQRGAADRLPAHWRRYASRFPKGRYIDEARAGLCRTAPPDRALECWRAYLNDRPRGTYRQHARDIVERGG